MRLSSFVYSMNKMGPSIDPCGTPIRKKHLLDLDLFMVTVNDLSLRYDLNQLRTTPEKPYFALSLDRRVWWFTV